MTIKDFSGEYSFLSPTYHFPATYCKLEYPTLGTAVIAAMTSSTSQRAKMRTMDAYDAYRLFNDVGTQAKFWKFNKRKIATAIIRNHFIDEDKYLYDMLIQSTPKDTDFVYLNDECDNFLGICTCEKCKSSNVVGLNILGSVLTDIRQNA